MFVLAKLVLDGDSFVQYQLEHIDVSDKLTSDDYINSNKYKHKIIIHNNLAYMNGVVVSKKGGRIDLKCILGHIDFDENLIEDYIVETGFVRWGAYYLFETDGETFSINNDT